MRHTQMPLAPQTQLGNYEILSRLGAGGMGEVYRARDTRLGRIVAIKVILEAYASDPERAARFQREAKMLAALNHPRIAGLYGLEEAGGVHFLVIELVEGETLAERLTRGAFPIEEAIAIALQIAEALEAAHEKGVIHRDLKPANIKITPDQQVKVLDFGLAKAIDNDAAQEAANSPTLSMMATQAGVILGTAAYMSPEQAKGFAVDHRSDVFSFGTVLFEMLTGRQPFRGDTAAEVLASVLVREAEVSGLPADTNPRLIELVMRCLQKNPKRRWQHIGDVRAELEALSAAPRSVITSAFAPVPQPLWRRAIVPAVCALAAAALAGVAVWNFAPAPARPVVSFAHILPEDQTFSNGGRPVLAISPDGGTLVYVANRRLYRRALSDLEAMPISGSDGADQGVTSPAFSPDGESLVFYSATDKSLKRIPVAGGAPFTLCEAQNPTGIHWSDGGIVFAQPDTGLMRVASAGGKPELLVKLGSGERAHMPQVLPGGTLLFSVATGLDAERWDKAKVVAFSMGTGTRKTLIDGGSAGRYLPSGHLLYAVGPTVFAQVMDARALEVSGAPMPVLEGVARSSSSQSGSAQMVVSPNGTLAYVPGAAGANPRMFELVVADRTGKVTPLGPPGGNYDSPRLSRDGRRLVLESFDGKQSAVLVYEMSGASPIRRVTLDANNRFPTWSHDGTKVTFTSDREGGDSAIYWQAADGTAPAERLTRPGAGERHIPESWSPDGKTLLLDVMTNDRHSLWTLSMADRKLSPYAGLESRVQMRASFSPDGKWIVYAIPRDGLMTVQVQPFPATGAKYELLVDGTERAHDPVWSPDGRELIYVAGPDRLWTVPVTTSPAFAFGKATPIPRSFPTAGPNIRGQYDLLPDGRIIGTRRVEPADAAGGPGAARATQQIKVVVNWMATLERLLSVR